MKYFDLTHTIEHSMIVFPGETPPSLLRDDLPEDAGYITFRLESNMHTGTHIDAPLHACSGNRTMDTFEPDLFTGKAAILDVRGETEVKMRSGWETIFRNHPVILFCTGHDTNWGNAKYYGEYPVFEEEVAHSLKENGVRIAGFDSPSPDRSPYSFHRIYLERERFLVENLKGLSRLIGVQEIEFFVFPLKIKAEASLVRAVACIRD